MNDDVDIEHGSVDDPTRTVRAIDQDFQLVGGGNEPICTGTIKLPLQITFKRFEIDKQ